MLVVKPTSWNSEDARLKHCTWRGSTRMFEHACIPTSGSMYVNAKVQRISLLITSFTWAVEMPPCQYAKRTIVFSYTTLPAELEALKKWHPRPTLPTPINRCRNIECIPAPKGEAQVPGTTTLFATEYQACATSNVWLRYINRHKELRLPHLAGTCPNTNV